ncbi:MAG: META domain-containing protein [Rhodobacteraceae bacterium]|nr:META domain-containing protein [Paracoccaceae bacterium]
MKPVLVAFVALGLASPILADPFAALPVGGAWRVTAIAGEALPANAEITLARPSAGLLAGTVICNQYSREVSAAGETLVVGGLTTTKMLCDVELFKFEFSFNDLLGKVDAVRAAGAGIEMLSGGTAVISAAK